MSRENYESFERRRAQIFKAASMEMERIGTSRLRDIWGAATALAAAKVGGEEVAESLIKQYGW